MMSIMRLMKADFIKMKHTPFYLIHLFIPLIGIFIFLEYYSSSKLSAVSKVNGYLEALSLAFPLLIGIVSSMIIEKEAEAGNFKEMMSIEYGRGICLLSKILVLLLMGFMSLSLAIVGFFIGFKYILKQNMLPLRFYMMMTLIIFAAQIFLYLFHLWLSLKIVSGASIGMGIFESMVAGIFITGLGDGIWKWVPCAWSIRFGDNFFVKEVNSSDVFNKLADINMMINNSRDGFINCILFTVIFAIFLMLWFNSFEGRAEK